MRPLVLLHGWGLGPRVWTGLAAALAYDGPVHAPALPGHDVPPAAIALPGHPGPSTATAPTGHDEAPAAIALPGHDAPPAAMAQPDHDEAHAAAVLSGRAGPSAATASSARMARTLATVAADALAAERRDQSGLAAWSDALACALPNGALVCGWSLGALVALDLARRHPEKVARLVLIGSTPRFVSCAAEDAFGPWPHGLDAGTVTNFIDGFASDPNATLRRFIALQALGDARRRAVGGALADALTPVDAERRAALAAGLDLLAASDLRAEATAIAQPALLLHGAGDALMPVGAAAWLAAALPDARLEVFDDCGHAPFLSRPRDCAALIAGFAHD